MACCPSSPYRTRGSAPRTPTRGGTTWATLAAALRLLTSEPAEQSATRPGPAATQRFGVLVDWCSMYQHPDPARGVLRAADEQEAFDAGLNALSLFYSAPGTVVLRLTALPAGYPESYALPAGANCATYAERGWCYTESMMAALTKGADHSLDLSRMSGQEAGREALVAACARGGGRPPPLLPAQFGEALATKRFSKGEDLPVVARLYEHAFHAAFRNVHVLDYRGLGWGDAELAQVAAVLAAVSAPLRADRRWDRASRATPLNELYVSGNAFGDEGCAALLHAAAELRELTWLSLSANPGLGSASLRLLATLLADKSKFRRLKEVRAGGHGASAAAKAALEKAGKESTVTIVA